MIRLSRRLQSRREMRRQIDRTVAYAQRCRAVCGPQDTLAVVLDAVVLSLTAPVRRG